VIVISSLTETICFFPYWASSNACVCVCLSIFFFFFLFPYSSSFFFPSFFLATIEWLRRKKNKHSSFLYASGIYTTTTTMTTRVLSEYNKLFVGFCCRKKNLNDRRHFLFFLLDRINYQRILFQIPVNEETFLHLNGRFVEQMIFIHLD
jgi:hypothetical protein